MQKWDGGDTADVIDVDKLAVLADKGIFGPIKKLRTEDILCNNAEALRFGAVVKKRMISYFRSLLNETRDPHARRVLEDIIKQEERHLDRLNLLLAY